MLRKFPVLFLALIIGAVSVFAQDAQVRNLANGQKYKIKGVVVAKDANSFVVRDTVGVETKVMLSPSTSIKTKGGFFGGGNKIDTNQIVRGLNLELEGRGDTMGGLMAEKVRFGKDDLRTAQSLESRVAPAEDRLTQTEQNAQRISGQIDELPKVITLDDGDEVIAIRSMAYLALTYDHRIVDGSDAEKFLSYLKEYLETTQFSI